MAQKRDSPNWKKIKSEYLRGGISQRQLAEKYGVSISTVERRARLEKWTELRAAREGKATEMLIQKTADIQANTAAKMLQVQTDAALALYEKLMANIANYPDGVGTKTMRETVEVKKVTVNGEAKEFPLKSAFVNDLEAIVRSLTSLGKLFGLDAASQQSRERFEMQKRQEGGASGDDLNASILSIAELINHPMPNRTMDEVEASDALLEGGEADG